MDLTNPTALTDGDEAGLWIIVAVAILSATSVTGLLVYIYFTLIKDGSNLELELEPLNNAGPYYFTNLLVCDVMMALGSIMDAKWAIDGIVNFGSYCTAQAVIKQLGNVGVAWTTTLIAIHSIIQYDNVIDNHPHRTGIVSIIIIWAGLILLVVIPAKVNPQYYGPSGKWCWITTRWNTQRIVTEYLFFWICAGVSLLIYGIIVLKAGDRLRGSFGRDGIWIGIYGSGNSGLGCGIFALPNRPGSSRASIAGQDPGEVALGQREPQLNHVGNNGVREDRDMVRARVRQAKRLLWYPAAYVVIIVPQSLIRLIQFNQSVKMPMWATTLGASIFALSGLINVVLYIAGCRHFGFPEPKPRQSVEEEK